MRAAKTYTIIAYDILDDITHISTAGSSERAEAVRLAYENDEGNAYAVIYPGFVLESELEFMEVENDESQKAQGEKGL